MKNKKEIAEKITKSGLPKIKKVRKPKSATKKFQKPKHFGDTFSI
jgi:hypothetical protein